MSLVRPAARSQQPEARNPAIFSILNIEQGISNNEVFFSFDIQHSIFDTLRFSVF
jgi:hypothetical protein